MRDVLSHGHTVYTCAGGRGSCKSSTIAELIIILMLEHSDIFVLAARKVKDTLKDSVYNQLVWAINQLGVADRFHIGKSPMEITLRKTGQKIYFRGLDDPEKIKGLNPPFGRIRITWFEESTEMTAKDMADVKATTMRGSGVFWVFDSYNPPASRRNWKNKDALTGEPGIVCTGNRMFHFSDYRSVPHDWLGDALFEEIETMRKTNERMYRNVFLGEATGTGKNIFENVKQRAITADEIKAFDWPYYGIDWGYYPDPFMWGNVAYDSKNNRLFIYDELKLLKHGNWEASEALKKKHPAMNDLITADSAEPKSVADFHEWGWNICGAVKGKGSLEAGFKWMQSLSEIIIDPERCPNAADEFSLYEYDYDKKTGEIMTGYPQGQPDHYMALTRYALEQVWSRRGM